MSNQGNFYLADDTNAAVDVLAGGHISFLDPGGFAGVAGCQSSPPDYSQEGPTGVLVERGFLWAGNGDSSLRVFRLSDGKLLATFSEATAGLEQPRYARGLLFQAIPATTAHPGGEIDVIHPATHKVLKQYVMTGNCGPSGLVILEEIAATLKAFCMALGDCLRMSCAESPILVPVIQEHTRSAILAQFGTCTITMHVVVPDLCLTIFSCSCSPSYQAAGLAQNWFSASAGTLTVTFRGEPTHQVAEEARLDRGTS